jgi:hypothetical protein
MIRPPFTFADAVKTGNVESYHPVKSTIEAMGIGLTSLEGCPKHVSIFNVDSNHLEDLRHGPVIVDGYFSCEKNPLKSLDGFPKVITGRVYIDSRLNRGENLYIITAARIRGNIHHKNYILNHILDEFTVP